MFSIIVSVSLFGLICAGQSQTQSRTVSLPDFENLDHCEGKDAANYTIVDTYKLDSSCDTPVIDKTFLPKLISYSPNGQNKVNNLILLAYSRKSAGANNHYEDLYLVSSGSLQGKFVYTKEFGLSERYLKKCSSVLGISYISSESLVMLIGEKLDLKIFLNPGGAYEAFKRSASTICTGITTTF